MGFLSLQGITADLVEDATPVLARLEENPPNLLVVHEQAGGNALPTLQRIRTVSRVPCIVVGDEADSERCIGLLDAGADDLVARETPLPTILARMRAVLRRGAWGFAGDQPASSPPQSGPYWRLMRTRRELYRPDGVECRLTTAEFDLFCLLIASQPGAVSREAICREVFRRRWRSEDRSVDNLVVRLRRKLADDGRATIRTLHGRGYAFVGFEGASLQEA